MKIRFCAFVGHKWGKIEWGRRFCSRCGLEQIEMYHRYGKIRFSWKDMIRRRLP